MHDGTFDALSTSFAFTVISSNLVLITHVTTIQVYRRNLMVNFSFKMHVRAVKAALSSQQGNEVYRLLLKGRWMFNAWDKTMGLEEFKHVDFAKQS